MIHCFWNIIIHCFWNIIIERNCNAQKMGVQWVHWESSSVLMKIDLAPPPGHRSGGRRSRTALIWLLHLRGTAQEGRGQIDLAPPPHLRCPLLHGAPEVEQPCFLVGNNQLSSPTPYTLYYYRPELVMLIAANHSEYGQFCTLDVVKKSENETEQWKRNTKYQNREIQRKNWGGASGQTGCAWVDK